MLHLIPILALAMLWSSTLTAQPILHLSTDSTDIQIDSLEPGSSVALFGAHRRLEGFTTVAGGLQEILADEDGDGSVNFALENVGAGVGVPLASVWIAVDLTSGLSNVAWPEEFQPSTLAEPTLRLNTLDGAEEATEALEISGRLLEVFLVRPGSDAQVWHQSLANGGPKDRDPDPTSMSLRLEELNALAEGTAEAAPAPASLEAQDLVILLDPTRLRWQVAQGNALIELAEIAAAGGAR